MQKLVLRRFVFDKFHCTYLMRKNTVRKIKLYTFIMFDISIVIFLLSQQLFKYLQNV